MLIKGFRFGLLLQIAIGPVCLYIIKTATESGIAAAEAGVAAATLMDTVFVLLAIIGIGALLEKPGVKMMLHYFGVFILAYFGLGVLLGSFAIRIIPSLESNTAASGSFVTSLVLTASSPLSILFWTGVFAVKMTHEGFSKKEMVRFGAGVVMATPIFLGTVALIAGSLHRFMTPSVIRIVNGAVGLVLIGFAVKMWVSRPNTASTETTR